jgi:hypothetical protein
MNMLVDVLKVSNSPEGSGSGHWTFVQNPDSGALLREWVDDDPNTVGTVEGGAIIGVPCIVRGITGNGIKGVGNTQSFDQIYQNIEWLRMQVPAGYSITKRDKVTRIRDLDGNILWKEEEAEGTPASVYSVMGVTPVVGPFGKAIEYEILLKRSEVQ